MEAGELIDGSSDLSAIFKAESRLALGLRGPCTFPGVGRTVLLSFWHQCVAVHQVGIIASEQQILRPCSSSSRRPSQ